MGKFNAHVAMCLKKRARTTCEICAMTFSNRNNMRRHVGEIHQRVRGPRPQMVAGHQVQPGSENRTQMLLQQRQPPPNTVENVNQVTLGSEVLQVFNKYYFSGKSHSGPQ